MTITDAIPRPWHSRHYLPHYEGRQVIQMITFRLVDALPGDVAVRLAQMACSPDQRRQAEAYLDAGHGACWLRDAEVARVCAGAFERGDGVQYELHGWVIMPNHVHVLAHVLPPNSLGEIVKGWKAVVARCIKRKIGRSGAVWQREYWDRWIRDAAHYANAVSYIRDNPAKAGLAESFSRWPWVGFPGSAGAPTGVFPQAMKPDAGGGTGAPRRNP